MFFYELVPFCFSQLLIRSFHRQQKQIRSKTHLTNHKISSLLLQWAVPLKLQIIRAFFCLLITWCSQGDFFCASFLNKTFLCLSFCNSFSMFVIVICLSRQLHSGVATGNHPAIHTFDLASVLRQMAK